MAELAREAEIARGVEIARVESEIAKQVGLEIRKMKSMRVSSGDVYEGRWKDDKRESEGKMVYPDCDVYEGQWKDDKRESEGKMVYDDGDVSPELRSFRQTPLFLGGAQNKGSSFTMVHNKVRGMFFRS